MENPKKQLIERIKGANNVLVTVSTNPSVDQLSAAIGLTLMLNKMGKHGTAVFSGQVPSTIEFLQPEKTLEKNTDSLRDFIIALDKSKADKLRYKVEDSHVKIFITPYRTSITEADLEFSQGDFNVEVVVALGVNEQRDLDQAITVHGRILHDATTVSVTTGGQSTLGSINWSDNGASSLCEMIASLADALQPNLLDGQMATALMTGIVAETDRFSNDKTASTTMSLSAALMAAGANQQLVASKLQEEQVVEVATPDSPAPTGNAGGEQPAGGSDGSLSIDHNEPADTDHNDSEPQAELPEIQETPEEPVEEIHINEDGSIEGKDTDEAPADNDEAPDNQASVIQGGSSLILDPPSLGGKLTANSEPEHLDPATDPLAGGHDGPLLTRDDPQNITVQPDEAPESPEPTAEPETPADVADAPGPIVPPEPAPAAEPVPDVPAPEPQPVDVPAVPQSDTPLPEPSMQLPSEEPVLTPVPTPSEQSIQLPDQPVVPPSEPAAEFTDDTPQTLSDLEAAVRAATEPAPAPENPLPDFSAPEPAPSPEATQVASLDSARDAVSDALASIQNQPLPPIAALNAQPLDLEIAQTGETGIMDNPVAGTENAEFTMPENLVPDTGLPTDVTAAPVDDPAAPPTVPPPFMPDTMDFNPPAGPQPGADNGAAQQANPQNPFGLPPA